MKTDIWLPDFQTLSPGYEIFSWLPLCKEHWPTIEDYNQLSNPLLPLQNQLGLPIQFIDSITLNSIHNYEATIFTTGLVSTRRANWHDYFNMLIWKTFPSIKATINQLHYQQQRQRQNSATKRTAIENLLTLFDESGIIVVSSDNTLLNLIQTMSWKELFWHRRAELNSKLKCYIFGHSIHEKLLRPYIGMIGHSVLITVSSDFFEYNTNDQIKEINLLLRHWLINLPATITPRILLPLPFLGLPDWFDDNDCEDFYHNTNYFRHSRSESHAK